jgi:hypothetical protein
MTLHNYNHKKLITNRIGRQYWIWYNDKLYEQRLARENGPYQARNLKMVRTCYPTAKTIIDVGVNIGMNTIEYATWADNVIGFEPMKGSLELAKLNIEIAKKAKLTGRYWNSQEQKIEHQPDRPDGWFKLPNGDFASLDIVGDITLHNVALGNYVGKAVMEEKTNECSRGDAVLLNNKVTKNPTQEIDMTTLDSYNLSNVDVIKIDVEGSELHVLEGAPTLIETQQPLIQVELRDTHCKRFGYTPDDIIQYVMGKGDYVMSDFNGNNLGEKYEKVKGVMDRFFIPQQIFSTLNIKKTVHPGMKLNTASTFQNLFEEKC